jgi:hypothetical protein
MEPVKNVTGLERFGCLSSELSVPRTQINCGAEADKATRDFTASVGWRQVNALGLEQLSAWFRLDHLSKHKPEAEKTVARIQGFPM